jgi:adenylate cyclase
VSSDGDTERPPCGDSYASRERLHLADLGPVDGLNSTLGTAKVRTIRGARPLERDFDAWAHGVIAGLPVPFHSLRAAISSGTDDAAALAIAAIGILHLDHDGQTALSAIARALSLNGSSATALYFGAHIHAVSGDSLTAEDYANRALRLSPFDSFGFMAHWALGIARLREERYAEAATCLAKAVQLNPRFSALYAFQATVLALAGRIEAAQSAARRLLELEPGFRTQPLVATYGAYALPGIVERFATGARQAGLPE